MKINKRTFGEAKDWAFKLTEVMERTYSMDIEASLLKLKEINWEINTIPKKIEQLEAQKKDLIKFYNEWLEVLEEAKEHYKGEFEELELPEKI